MEYNIKNLFKRISFSNWVFVYPLFIDIPIQINEKSQIMIIDMILLKRL